MEDAAHLVGRNAYPRVRYAEIQKLRLRGRGRLRAASVRRSLVRLKADAHRDFAGFGEFDGVTDKVDDDLLQPAGITAPRIAHGRWDVEQQFQPFFARLDRERFDGLGEFLAERKLDRLELKLAGFDFGKVENVVDEPQQRVGRVFDRFHITPLSRVQGRAQRQIRHANDGVHWGADFVAHVCQEVALGTTGRFGCLLGQFQLFLRSQSFDGLRDARSDCGQRIQNLACERLKGEYGQDAHARFTHQQRIAGKRNDSFVTRPFRIAGGRVAGQVVHQSRHIFLRDHTDRELADRDAAVRAVETGVQAGAGLQLQLGALQVKHPDSGEGRIEVLLHGYRASMKHRGYALVVAEGMVHVGAKCKQPRLFLAFCFRLPSLGLVAQCGVDQGVLAGFHRGKARLLAGHQSFFSLQRFLGRREGRGSSIQPASIKGNPDEQNHQCQTQCSFDRAHRSRPRQLDLQLVPLNISRARLQTDEDGVELSEFASHPGQVSASLVWLIVSKTRKNQSRVAGY